MQGVYTYPNLEGSNFVMCHTLQMLKDKPSLAMKIQVVVPSIMALPRTMVSSMQAQSRQHINGMIKRKQAIGINELWYLTRRMHGLILNLIHLAFVKC